MNKYILPLIGLFLVIYACNQLVSSKSSSFKLVNATVTRWTAGIPDGGSGTDYNLSLYLKTNEKIIFDSIWVDGERMLCESQLMKKDLMEVRTTKFDIAPHNRSDFKPVKPPYFHNGKALIRYTSKGRTHFFVIKNFNELKPINLP
ncbi:MAG: hypothetical protein EXR21_04255 [Flavobacteriaceae bacterium]|nr:hypothetical protein [Flavobacteriaceae bacterium]